MTPNRWHPSEWQRVQRLLANGHTPASIADMIGRKDYQIRDKIRWEGMSAAQREDRATKMTARRKAHRERLKLEHKSPRTHLEMVSGPRPTERALADRALRYAALPRDLTGAFFGDPPVGFSALEQRV